MEKIVNLYIYIILLGLAFFYANWRIWLKKWLVQVPEKSLRFRIAASFWTPKRLRHTKACLLYWYYLPVVIAAYAVGLFFMICVGIPLIIAAWFCGFTFSGIKNQGADEYDQKGGFYPYKYSPRTGRRKGFAPWQYSLIFLSTIGIIFLTAATRWLIISIKEGAGQQAISSVGSSVAHSLPILIVLASIAALSILLSVLYQNRYRLLRLWNEKMCPDLVIIEENKK